MAVKRIDKKVARALALPRLKARPGASKGKKTALGEAGFSGQEEHWFAWKGRALRGVRRRPLARPDFQGKKSTGLPGLLPKKEAIKTR